MKKLLLCTLALTFFIALPSFSNPNYEKNNFSKIRKRFEKIDKNRDGLLSKDEMIEAHRVRIDNLYEKFDKDNDDKLSKKELRAVRKEMKKRIEKLKNEGD